MNENQKYQIIMQGMASGNVAKTCKEFGISRTLYYRWYNDYLQLGMEGLAQRPRCPVMPNKVNRQTEKMILNYVARYPQDGPRRISYELEDEGIQIGESGVYNVLCRNGLSRREAREQYALEVKLNKRPSRNNNQTTSYKKDRCAPALDFKLANPEHAYPGYICYQNIHFLGRLPGAGKVYQYITLDSFSRLGLVKLYTERSTDCLIDFMNLKIRPLLRTFQLDIEHLVTDRSQEFTTAWERGTHKYREYLHKHDIQAYAYHAEHHEVFQPLHAFKALLADKFYKPLLQQGKVTSYEMLEQQLNEFMNYYNYQRPLHSIDGRGRTPSELVLEHRRTQGPLPLWLYTRR